MLRAPSQPTTYRALTVSRLSLVRSVKPFERDGRAVAPLRRRVCRRLNGNHAPPVIGLELRGRSAHHIKIEVMHARLVENDMRKFRQPIFDILHPAAADDVRRLLFVRLPKRRLVDPAGFLQHPLAEAEGMEHLHRPAGDAVGLAEQHATWFLLDDAGLDVGKSGQLRRQRQPCRSAADDQDIDLAREPILAPGGRISLGPVGNLRVARLESIQMKLHDHSPSAAVSAGALRSVGSIRASTASLCAWSGAGCGQRYRGHA